MVEADVVEEAGFADGFEEADGTEAGDVAGVFRDIEGDADVALGAEVINFVWLNLVKELHEADGVSKIAIMKEEFCIVFVGILVKVVNAPGIEGGGAADEAVNFVAFCKEEFS